VTSKIAVTAVITRDLVIENQTLSAAKARE